MIAVRKNVGTGKPMEARIVDDGRKAKIFPAPDATKKNAIKQRAIVAISIPLPFAPLPALCFVGELPPQDGAGSARMLEQDLSDCSESFCARPIALQFSGHRQPCNRLGPRGDKPAD